MKTSSTIGWAIYSPQFKSIVMATARETRRESIHASGCLCVEQWKELYRMGYRAKKVSIKEIK